MGYIHAKIPLFELAVSPGFHSKLPSDLTWKNGLKLTVDCIHVPTLIDKPLDNSQKQRNSTFPLNS